jgi:hypothetical protein
MKKHTATLVILLLAFGLSGCPLAKVTESFEYDVIKEANGGVPIDLTGQDNWYRFIDLNDDDTFKENRDKIDEIERVTFQADMYTLNDADAIVDIYFREYVEDVPEGEGPPSWMLILEDLRVRGDSNEDAPLQITYEGSEPLIKNFTQFQKLAEGGVMELGLDARGGNDEVLVTKLILYIALSGG